MGRPLGQPLVWAALQRVDVPLSASEVWGVGTKGVVAWGVVCETEGKEGSGRRRVQQGGDQRQGWVGPWTEADRHKEEKKTSRQKPQHALAAR